VNKRDRIINTAYKLFVNSGYRGVSVNDIIVEAGISKGGFYHHFSHKEELLEAAMEISFYKDYEDLKKFFGQKGISPEWKLRNIFDILMAAFNEWKEEFTKDGLQMYGYALLQMEAVHQVPEIREKFTVYYQELTELVARVIREGKEKGTLREDLDCERMAFIWMVMFDGLYTKYVYDKNLDMEKAHTDLQKTFWELIGPK